MILRLLIEKKTIIHNEYLKLIHKRYDKLADYEIAVSTTKNVSVLFLKLLVFTKIFCVY